jgi:uncharacterized protein YbjT (DUF2867 family)
MQVLIAGGTGFVGRNLCEELRERGHDVTALARTADPAAVPDDVAVVAGDVTDRATLDDPMAGMDAVVNLVALSPLFQPSGGDEMHDVIHRGGTENLVDAAEAHDVDRFVQMSALGADPDGDTHYIRAKGRAEAIVRESDLAWTVLRPSVIFGEGGEFVSFTLKLTPPILAPLPGGGATRFQPIHVGDMVAILGDALEDEAHVGESYDIGGPEVLRLADVAKLGRRAKGQSVRILPIPMALAGIGLRIGGAIPGFPMGADQYRSLQFDNTVADNEVPAFGYDPADLTTLESYLGLA